MVVTVAFRNMKRLIGKTDSVSVLNVRKLSCSDSFKIHDIADTGKKPKVCIHYGMLSLTTVLFDTMKDSKVAGLSECLPTMLTHIGLLSRVTSFMCSKSTVGSIGFPTILTHKGFLSCVTSFMCLKGTVGRIGFPTVLTHIGFLSCVISLMDLNITLSLKTFPTLFTCIVSFPSMGSFMILKRTEILKGFITLFTDIGFLLCVKLFMLQKALGGTKSHSIVFIFTWLLSLFFIRMCFASSLTSEGHIQR